MSAAESEPLTLETRCSECGPVTAVLQDGSFHCPECGARIPREVVETEPSPGGVGDGE